MGNSGSSSPTSTKNLIKEEKRNYLERDNGLLKLDNGDIIKVFSGQVKDDELICEAMKVFKDETDVKSGTSTNSTGNDSYSLHRLYAISANPLLTHEADDFFKPALNGICIIMGTEEKYKQRAFQIHSKCCGSNSLSIFKNLDYYNHYPDTSKKYNKNLERTGYYEKKFLMDEFISHHKYLSQKLPIITCAEKKEIFDYLETMLGFNKNLVSIIAKQVLNEVTGMMTDRNNLCICDNADDISSGSFNVCRRFILPHPAKFAKKGRKYKYLEKFNEIHEKKLLDAYKHYGIYDIAKSESVPSCNQNSEEKIFGKENLLCQKIVEQMLDNS
jgi:hypothetical protein